MNISDTYLFRGIDPKDVKEMLSCLHAQKKHFSAGERLFSELENGVRVGVLLEGRAVLERIDEGGTRSVLAYYDPQDIFYIHLDERAEREGKSAVAETDCDILFIDHLHTTRMCEKACERHSTLVKNLLRLMNNKIGRLNRRIEILASRNIREKLMAYFEDISNGKPNRTVSLPFNLTQLADYLCTDRSAMMREIKKLKDDGYILLKNGKLTLKKHL